jgi:hypothetical protein
MVAVMIGVDPHKGSHTAVAIWGSPESVDTLIGLILPVPLPVSCHVTAGAQALSRWSPRRTVPSGTAEKERP